jgi:hypothetical protein
LQALIAKGKALPPTITGRCFLTIRPSKMTLTYPVEVVLKLTGTKLHVATIEGTPLVMVKSSAKE